MVHIPGTDRRPRGSFGIPDEMREAAEKQHASRKTQRPETEKPGAEAASEEAEPEYEPGTVDTDASGLLTDEDAKRANPTAMLKEIGIELTEDDMHQLLFYKGCISKEVVVYKSPSAGNTIEFKATIKSLTPREYDVVDELLTEEIEARQVTRAGAESRRGMWILALGVTHFQGRPLRNIDKETDYADEKDETRRRAKLYRDVLAGCATPVVTKLLRMHGAMTSALNLLIEDSSSPFLSNS